MFFVRFFVQRYKINWSTGAFGVSESFLKKCADSAMILGKFNQDLLRLRKDSITPELKTAYKHLSFPQGEHSKLLFGDDLLRSITEITETYTAWKVSKYTFHGMP